MSENEKDVTQEADGADERLQTSVERLGPCECIIKIAADADLLRERYMHELAEMQTEAQVQGFRRGKAPVGLVERKMGGALRKDVVGSVVSEAYDEAVADADLHVVSELEAPDLDALAWEPGQPLAVEFKVEVLPDLELDEKAYKGVEIEVPALVADDELKAREMERFAQQFATWEELKETIGEDDYVEADVSVDGADFSETIGFYPRAGRIGPFTVESPKDGIVGATVGAELQMPAQVNPDEAGRRPELQALVGDELTLKLKITQAARRQVPEVDDDLARKLGMENVAEIETMVADRLDAAIKARKDETARHVLLDRLLDNVPCEMPPSLVERAAGREQLRTLVRLLRSGVPRQEAERISTEGAERTREAVERRLKAEHVLRKIAEAERVFVTESEVDSQIAAFAARQGWREERARTYMEDRGMLRALRDDMREGKTIDMLLESAQVKEVSPEEFAEHHTHGEETEGQ